MRAIIISTVLLWVSVAFGQQQGISEQSSTDNNGKSIQDSVSGPSLQLPLQDAAAGGAAHNGKGMRQDYEASNKDNSSESEGKIIEPDVNTGQLKSYSTSGGGPGGNENQPDDASSPELKTDQLPDSSNANSEND